MTREIPIRDTVALSVTAHNIVHWKIFWKNKKVRPYINYFLRKVCRGEAPHGELYGFV